MNSTNDTKKKSKAVILLTDALVIEIRTKYQKEHWTINEILEFYGEKYKLSRVYVRNLLDYIVRSKLIVY